MKETPKYPWMIPCPDFIGYSNESLKFLKQGFTVAMNRTYNYFYKGALDGWSPASKLPEISKNYIGERSEIMLVVARMDKQLVRCLGFYSFADNDSGWKSLDYMVNLDVVLWQSFPDIPEIESIERILADRKFELSSRKSVGDGGLSELEDEITGLESVVAKLA